MSWRYPRTGKLSLKDYCLSPMNLRIMVQDLRCFWRDSQDSDHAMMILLISDKLPKKPRARHGGVERYTVDIRGRCDKICQTPKELEKLHTKEGNNNWSSQNYVNVEADNWSARKRRVIRCRWKFLGKTVPLKTGWNPTRICKTYKISKTLSSPSKKRSGATESPGSRGNESQVKCLTMKSLTNTIQGFSSQATTIWAVPGG